MGRMVTCSVILLAPVWASGAATGPLIEPPPGSTIEARRVVDKPLGYDLVLSPVEKIHGDLRIENAVRAHGELTRLTYRLPAGISVAEAVAHFRGQLGGDVLFECDGLDCGRSTLWANQVFGVAELYGPDRDQHYLAVRSSGRFIALYVVQRGNRRVYAHLDFINAGSASADKPAVDDLVDLLRVRGYAAIPGVEPLPDGTLPDAAVKALAAVGESLGELDVRRRAVVCHLYDGPDDRALLTASVRCAERVAEILAAAGGGAWPSFGAGPIAPREGQGARVELVTDTAAP